MKKLITLAFCGLVLAAQFACDNDAKEENEVVALRLYVDSVAALDWSDNTRDWNEVETAYKTRIEVIESNSAEWTEEQKAEYQRIQSDYENLRQRYNNQRAELNRLRLRDALYGEGRVNDNLDFSWMTPENANETYTRFTNTVEANRATYTAEEWAEISRYYDAMEARRNQFDKKEWKDAAEKENKNLRKRYEDFKEDFEDSVKDAKDDIKDAADDAKDAMKDAKDDMKDAKDDMKDNLKKD